MSQKLGEALAVGLNNGAYSLLNCWQLTCGRAIVIKHALDEVELFGIGVRHHFFTFYHFYFSAKHLAALRKRDIVDLDDMHYVRVLVVPQAYMMQRHGK